MNDTPTPEEVMESIRDRFWDLAMKATVPVAFLTGSALVAHEVRLAKIEDSRFTARDGVVLEARVKDDCRANSVPAWLKEDIGEIKTSIKAIEGRLRTLEGRNR